MSPASAFTFVLGQVFSIIAALRVEDFVQLPKIFPPVPSVVIQRMPTEG